MIGLGALGGVLSAMVSEGFKLFKASGERKHELKLLDLQLAIGQQETEREVAISSIEAERDALVNSREHDMAIQNTSLWVADLRASLRPFVTYFVIVVAFVIFFNSKENPTEIQKVITSSFMLLMEATTTFWFTGRALGKSK